MHEQQVGGAFVITPKHVRRLAPASLPVPAQCGGRACKAGVRFLLLVRDEAEESRTMKLIR